MREVIFVENLVKSFKLYKNPRDRLKELFHPFRKKFFRNFIALNEVSFTVEEGEVLGILGRNGAGKSTLLKILTDVLSSTSGNVRVNGSVAALLELGAGFNLDLTGRNNIFFQGAILGFRKEEIQQMVPTIIEFADIGEFIDQPVKTYSSGMFARLAFSIAINVDPDVLIVDEALSVGDIRFQQKCLRKMKEFNERGKTVIYVSHDVTQIKSLCTKALWLKDSKVELYGDASFVCDEYLSWMAYGESSQRNRKHREHPKSITLNDWVDVSHLDSFGKGGAEVISYRVKNLTNTESNFFSSGDEVLIGFKIKVNKMIASPGVGVLFKNRSGIEVFTLNNYIYSSNITTWTEGEVKDVTLQFFLPSLLNGDYSAAVGISDGTQEDHSMENWVYDIFVIKSFNDSIAYKLGSAFILDAKNVKIIES